MRYLFKITIILVKVLLLHITSCAKPQKVTTVLERVEVLSLNKSVADLFITVSFHNRTTKIISGYFMVRDQKQITINNKVIIRASMYLSNRYMLIPAMEVEMTWKNVMEFKFFNTRYFTHHACRPVVEWPLKPKTYYNITGYPVNGDAFPSGVPSGRYMVENLFYTDDGYLVGNVVGYGELSYNVEYVKKPKK